MRVEHYVPQGQAPEQRFVWENLLGVCTGSLADEWICERHRGSNALSIDPRRPDHVGSLAYAADGELRSTSAEHQHDIDQTLRLNVDILKRNRRAALKGWLEALGSPRFVGRMRQRLEHCRRQLQAPEYLGVLEYWAERRLARQR